MPNKMKNYKNNGSNGSNGSNGFKTLTGSPQWVFVPLGGSGEIGMNLNLYGFLDGKGRETWIVVDIGVTFANNGTVPGVEVIMADPAFIEARRDNLAAIVLTHGHEDHIGAIAHLWPNLKCPLYATEFTSRLIYHKLLEAGLDDDVEINIVNPSRRLKIDPFEIEFVGLTHSIPEPNALAIRTSLGTILHTGDWKIDPDPMLGNKIEDKRLQQIGEEGVLSIVCDSTNVFNEGSSGSEGRVYDTLFDIIGQAGEARVFVTSFASNVARMTSVARAAEAAGRRVALIGRAMQRMAGVAQETGLLGAIKPFLTPEEGAALPRDQVVFLCTGSQGEPRAALSRIADGSHNCVRLNHGDLVLFSSREIPGNEVNIYALQNALTFCGAQIFTSHNAPGIHVSGHPCREELALMYEWVQPQSLIPVHGERRHLVEHAAFAQSHQIGNCVVVTNGAVVQLAPGPVRRIGKVDHGRLYLDGHIPVRAGQDGPVRMRRHLARSGLVSISLVLEQDGSLAAPMRVVLSGAPPADRQGRSLSQLALAAAKDAFAQLSAKDLRQDDVILGKIRRIVRHTLFASWGKKPETHIHISRI